MDLYENTIEFFLIMKQIDQSHILKSSEVHSHGPVWKYYWIFF